MNREIKFRAWGLNPKTSIRGILNDFNKIKIIGANRATVYWKDESYSGGVFLMQFTGLHDKNGKEIYEGDVVASEFGGKDKVMWDDAHAGFAPFSHQIFSAADTFSEWNLGWVEVIGNIYENPELIGDNEPRI